MAVRKIKASSIAEMAIALAIIAICFMVASQVFMQASRSTIQFKEVREQTEFQSLMLDALINDTLPESKGWKDGVGTIETEATTKDTITTTTLSLQSNGKTVWKQSFRHER